MPTLEWNKNTWKEYSWTDEGEEWSAAWGNSAAQWFGSVYPRIHSFLPCKSILEIAPGFGRWTKFLLGHCESYTGVDIADGCIEACQKKFFKSRDNAHFYKNNGLSLNFVPDNSVDFCFSFDSLVHVDIQILDAYIDELSRKLTSNGACFLHHSNFLEYVGAVDNIHHRDPTVSAKLVREALSRRGIQSVFQEKINWGGDLLIDAITIFTMDAKNNFSLDSIDNPYFMLEADTCKNVFANCMLNIA